MNHIDQIIAANEELTLAIESYGLAVKPISMGGISFALEEAQEDVKQEAKQGVFEKIKSLIARVVAWFKNLLFKKKEDKFTAPVYDSEKFKQGMEESFKKMNEQAAARTAKMKKELDEMLARSSELNSKAFREKMKQDIAADAERRRREAAAAAVAETAAIEKDVKKSEKAKALWKKFIEPNMSKYLQDIIRDKCGLLTALAKGGDISKDTVRFEDITAPIREFDNNLYTIVDNVKDTVHEVLTNLNDHKRMEGFIASVEESTKEIMAFSAKLEALSNVQPIAPNIDSSSINSIYRVVYDMSGKMPRSSIAGSVEILTKEMEDLEKAMASVKAVEGIANNASFKAIQDLITKVIVPATAQAQKCARVVSEVFHNFQEIGGLINKHSRNPETMSSYKSYIDAIKTEFGFTEDQQAARFALVSCDVYGTQYLYPENHNS